MKIIISTILLSERQINDTNKETILKFSRHNNFGNQSYPRIP